MYKAIQTHGEIDRGHMSRIATLSSEVWGNVKDVYKHSGKACAVTHFLIGAITFPFMYLEMLDYERPDLTDNCIFNRRRKKPAPFD